MWNGSHFAWIVVNMEFAKRGRVFLYIPYLFATFHVNRGFHFTSGSALCFLCEMKFIIYGVYYTWCPKLRIIYETFFAYNLLMNNEKRLKPFEGYSGHDLDNIRWSQSDLSYSKVLLKETVSIVCFSIKEFVSRLDHWILCFLIFFVGHLKNEGYRLRRHAKKNSASIHRNHTGISRKYEIIIFVYRIRNCMEVNDDHFEHLL